MIHGLEVQLITVVLVALIGIIPTAALAVKAYLNSLANKYQLEQRPTHDEVSTQIQQAVDNALVTNGAQNQGVK